ncbi:MAG: DNA cytosine methyltransferase [Rubrivivax sp.]|nr:DNA cytosine methyltransferase [Rubrivivax sp.]MDP3082674.1 DNA cytosine methyltransferase [Rubrivivax sp.]
MKIEAIDLFCGAGGLTRGLLDAGVRVKAGFDVDASCRHAYEANNPGARFFEKDVAKLTASELEKLWSKRAVRLLAGCAPCQPFSTQANASRENEPDPRYRLLDHFSRLIYACEPELVTMENVPSVVSHTPFKDFVSSLERAGYHVWFKSVACAKLGVPQTRRRLVLLASLIGPVRTGIEESDAAAPATVAQALQGLRPLRAGEMDPEDPIHFARGLTELNLLRLQASIPGGTWLDWPKELRSKCHRRKSGASFPSVYSRMRADEPSPTITTQFYNFGTGRFGHPTEDRAITPREAALLQSFPASYEFVKKGEEAYMSTLGRMIGNAVPPKLGAAIGRALVLHVGQSNVCDAPIRPAKLRDRVSN